MPKSWLANSKTQPVFPVLFIVLDRGTVLQSFQELRITTQHHATTHQADDLLLRRYMRRLPQVAKPGESYLVFLVRLCDCRQAFPPRAHHRDVTPQANEKATCHHPVHTARIEGSKIQIRSLADGLVTRNQLPVWSVCEGLSQKPQQSNPVLEAIHCGLVLCRKKTSR